MRTLLIMVLSLVIPVQSDSLFEWKNTTNPVISTMRQRVALEWKYESKEPVSSMVFTRFWDSSDNKVPVGKWTKEEGFDPDPFISTILEHTVDKIDGTNKTLVSLILDNPIHIDYDLQYNCQVNCGDLVPRNLSIELKALRPSWTHTEVDKHATLGKDVTFLWEYKYPFEAIVVFIRRENNNEMVEVGYWYQEEFTDIGQFVKRASVKKTPNENKTGEKISLTLQNVSVKDFGWEYVCQLTLGDGEQLLTKTKLKERDVKPNVVPLSVFRTDSKTYKSAGTGYSTIWLLVIVTSIIFHITHYQNFIKMVADLLLMLLSHVTTEPVRLIVIGKAGSGKSSLANALLGKKGRFKCGALPSSGTTRTEADEGYCKGNAVKVVDTPGFCDTNVDVEENTTEIMRCLALSGKGPNIFLYCIEIGRFSEEDAECFRRAKRLFGDSITDYMRIVFTNKDKLDKWGKTDKEYIESAPPKLKEALEEVSNKYIFINSTSDNLEPALHSLSTLINDVKTESLYTPTEYKAGIDILKRLVEVGRKYRKAYTQWKNKRADIIQQFSEWETDLNCKVKNVRISKVAGSVAGIIGTTMAVVGVLAAPLTFGTSIIVTAVGAAIGIAGGGAPATDLVITNKRKKQIDTLLKEDKELMDKLDKLAKSFEETLSEAFLNNEIKGVIKYVLRKSITRSDNKTFEKEVNKGLIKVWEYFLKILKAEKKCLGQDKKDTKHDAGVGAVNAAVTTGGQVAKTIAVATDATTDFVGSVARTTATAVKVTAIAASIITLPLDLHLKTKHQLANVIHDIMHNLKENKEDYDKDWGVIFTFVDEVEEFLFPPST